jgi:protein-S-isoprenylcysteine O-methyltransferase Ste14
MASPTTSPVRSDPVSPAVAIGNVLFHWRNGLFPIAFLAIALASRPRWFLGSPRADAILDVVGILVALSGQVLRALVIGLAYIQRGGKDRRIHADALVTEGLFRHSRNPLYVGNALVYLGLFLILNSTLGYGVGVPFFLFAYWCITLAEENFLLGRFGAAYADYCRSVPRYLPRLAGVGETMRSMEFDWRRLIRKEYGSTFSWMTTALGLLYWESFRNRGAEASRPVLVGVLAVWGVLLAGYLVARWLKKTRRLQSPS